MLHVRLQAASRLSFPSRPSILSLCFDGASIGKPSKDVLLIAQHAFPKDCSMILPPQLLAKKSSASQPKAKTRPMLPDQSAAEEFPLPAKNDARQANLAHLKAVDSAMTRSNGHGLAAFLPNRLVGALPHGARRYFVEQPCKLTADGVRQRAPWCKQICICIYVSINIDIYIYSKIYTYKYTCTTCPSVPS